MIKLLHKLSRNKINDYIKLVNDTRVFEKISYEKFLKLIKSGDHQIIYVGKPTCPQCRLFVPIVYSILEDKAERIYYFDIDSFDKNTYIDLFKQIELSDLPSLILTNGSMQYKRMKVYDNTTAIKAWLDVAKK